MDYQNICSHVQKIAREAGNFIRNEQAKIKATDIQTKSEANYVTYVDKTSEKMIVDALVRLLPGSGFVTEEGTAGNNREEMIWYVDPLDGTTNYIHGIFPVSVSIGLSCKEKMVMGVVYEIGRDELFYAWEGSKAYKNGEEIRASEPGRPIDTLVGTGFPYYDFSQSTNYLSALEELMKKTSGLRRMGSAAADLCYVAAGRLDAFFEHSLHAWDVAAGAFILQQAGGKVTDFNEGGNWLFGGEMVAAGIHYFPEFYKIVNRHLGNPTAKK